MMKIVLAITGASGTVYGLELARALCSHELHAIVTSSARKVMETELDDPDRRLAELSQIATVHAEDNLAAPVASGSFLFDAMVVCPCSMKTLSAIAGGFACNLVGRAADVALKEQRTLVLVPRETPLSAIHLQNMLDLARLGVVILPACPGFYGKPKEISDVVGFVVGKVLDSLRIPNASYQRWQGA